MARIYVHPKTTWSDTDKTSYVIAELDSHDMHLFSEAVDRLMAALIAQADEGAEPNLVDDILRVQNIRNEIEQTEFA